MRSSHLRGRDTYKSLSTTNNSFQNREIVDEVIWSSTAEWPQQKNSSLLTPVSSCGEGESFTISSQKHGDLAGCYEKTVHYKGEAIYTSKNRRGKKNMVAAMNFNETNANPNVRDLANVIEL